MNLKELSKSIGYEPYTQEYDQIVDVGQLLTPENMRGNLKHLVGQRNKLLGVRKLDPQLLMNGLLSELKGTLDDADVDASEVTVCFLVDCSGSSRGATADNMTMATIDATLALEQLGVETSVLGYTTAEWKGGQSRQQWVADGRPVNPGRLNDLQHIIYKRSDTSVMNALSELASLSDSTTKRENIDGEALMWAVDCMRELDRPKKVLINISDGFEPIDDATLVANQNNILLKHAVTISLAIEESGEISFARALVALGYNTFQRDTYERLKPALEAANHVLIASQAREETYETTLDTVMTALKTAISRVPEKNLSTAPRMG